MGEGLVFKRCRATIKWPVIFMAFTLITSLLTVLEVGASSPQVTFQLCRANVEPCQTEVSIPGNGTVDLDLLLSQTDPSGGAASLPIVAWEVHLRLADSPVAGLASKTSSGQPVQERGVPGLALDGLDSLRVGQDQDTAQYYTVQNRYDAGSGQLDYAVTLVRFDQAKPQPRVLPLAPTDQVNLGRVTVVGNGPGTSDISWHNSVVSPFQVVTLNSSGGLTALGPGNMSSTLAAINVGSVTTPELSGQIIPTALGDGAAPIPFPVELTITFWETGAIPSWQGGTDLPVATFRNVLTDSSGAFHVTDIAPAILPPATYDLRVKGRRTLTSLAPGVTVPASGAAGTPPAIAPGGLSSLREGDIDGSNVVDQADLLALKASFGILGSEPGFNSIADFNEDSVVDVLDFSRLAQNFGERGD